MSSTEFCNSSLYSASNVAQAKHFSSGNPRIEETRGVMHLYADNNLPVGRNPLLCVLGVSNHMTYADFCQFCGSFVQHMSEIRIVRFDSVEHGFKTTVNSLVVLWLSCEFIFDLFLTVDWGVRIDGMEDSYSSLIRFDSQNSADAFYKHFNGRHFSSLLEETCEVLFTVDVQYTGSIEHTHTSPASSMEQPSCPVCLERLDQDASGILTTICNHSFHCSCISKWTDSSCPVCRYCQQQPDKSICFICQTSENLWICVLCGFVGCGRYRAGHAIRHWKETQHCYSLELETQRVWDYVGDNYVHRLIQSKTDGKPVELNHYCDHSDNSCCDCVDAGFSEALLNSKVEAIVNEYNDLLNTQLENQRKYFESLLQEVEEDTELKTTEAVEKALFQNPKLLKMQGKLDKFQEEIKFLKEILENLSRNKEIWEAKVVEIEEREKKATGLKEARIEELEEELRNWMVCLETGNTEAGLGSSNGITNRSALTVKAESSSRSSGKGATRTNNRRRN